jgi:hypothetical protein
LLKFQHYLLHYMCSQHSCIWEKLYFKV